ncbi:DUF2490 domain-containing protein [Flavobacterium granuli]|uniref:DUF2490 domain-containing protein n=1 Tax=Flavobacterium granuli TaxID=280093 RepID=A0ABU1S600_9FLAO|nr:DUF2490 domain-containing protein [Flavobacterium granuli]MDR6846479.1 hypothetical protein [Flavobacterium granuli]
MKNLSKILAILFPFLIFGQGATKKEINQQVQTWVSLNSVTKFSEHWGVAADAHIRENGFFENNNFYFLRGGFSYFPGKSVSLTAGYAHMWLAPTKEGWSTYADENRIYQQAQLTTKVGKVSVLQRLRNEQRWQEKMENDESTGENRFTNRIRYLASFTIPIFNNKKLPSLVLSDELLIHFGKEVVYNTFDQNRLFIGIKQNITPELSYDFGYMNVYQQKYSGYQYDMNHTIRLFFYLNSAIKHNQAMAPEHHSGDE